MIFYDNKHETAYNDICSRMKYLDCYHRSLAYLPLIYIAIDIIKKNINFAEMIRKYELLGYKVEHRD